MEWRELNWNELNCSGGERLAQVGKRLRVPNCYDTLEFTCSKFESLLLQIATLNIK